MGSFSSFKLLPTLQAFLNEKGLVTPTEIQSRSIPVFLDGKSIVGVSETGSGKTLAYVLPILHLLKSLENQGQAITEESRPRAAVIVPTRELGEQVSKVFKPLTHSTRLRVRTVLGGTALDVAKRNVKGPFEVLVATPGRLVQLIERELVNMTDIRILIFDEVDQMLDQSFLSDAIRIEEDCPTSCQMGLFSATVSPVVQELINKLFAGAEIIRSSGSQKLVPTLKTINKTVVDGKRFPLMQKLLAEKIDGGTLVFTNTRQQCDTLSDLLKDNGYKCLVYRGEMDKIIRRNNLKAFREGKVDLLISTDLGSRGLDIDHIGRVVNYHLPKEMENYVHRVGRTARAGRKGLVINFVTERDESFIKKLESIKSNPSKSK